MSKASKSLPLANSISIRIRLNGSEEQLMLARQGKERSRMNPSKALRLFHTLRHLRPIQVANRAQRKLFPPKFRRVEAPGPPRSTTGSWQAPGHRRPSLIAETTIRVFQTELSIANSSDWNSPDLSYLERYNLHYFEDLAAAGANDRIAWHHKLIDRWIVDNPPGDGVGWEPYPLSIRIVNWIKWQLAGARLQPHQLDSLATQVEALGEQLEYHLLGNHLLANAKALVFAGCYFSGPRADRWRSIGSRLLVRELQEQVLQDGGHFELSPMYHSIILEDVFDVINLRQTYPELADEIPDLKKVARRMRRWLKTMCHGDGQISFFNDAAFDIAIAPNDIEAYASRLGLSPVDPPGEGITQLAESGYVRVQSGDAVLLLDVASVGPGYQPGHAHADTLSFEFSVAAQRLLVNSGTSQYGVDDERKRQRSTAAHNAVVVDEKNSSDIWSGFRVGHRARPGAVLVEESNQSFSVASSHDGYRNLPGRVVHHRRWTLSGNELEIADRIEGRFQQAVGHLHLHPDLTVDNDSFCWRWPDGSLRLVNADDAKVQPTTGTYHPRFGESQPNMGIRYQFSRPAHQLLFRWS